MFYRSLKKLDLTFVKKNRQNLFKQSTESKKLKKIFKTKKRINKVSYRLETLTNKITKAKTKIEYLLEFNKELES